MISSYLITDIFTSFIKSTNVVAPSFTSARLRREICTAVEALPTVGLWPLAPFADVDLQKIQVRG